MKEMFSLYSNRRIGIFLIKNIKYIIEGDIYLYFESLVDKRKNYRGNYLI